MLFKRVVDKGTIYFVLGCMGRWSFEGWIGVLRRVRWVIVGVEVGRLKGYGVYLEFF